MPLFVTRVEVEAEREVGALARRHRLDDRRLRHLVEREHDRARPRASAARRARAGSPADQAGDEPADDREHEDRDDRADVERADPRHEGAKEVQVRVRRVLDEAEHGAQGEVVGDRAELLDPAQDHVGDDQDEVDEDQRLDVVGDVAAGERQGGQAGRHLPRIRSSEAVTAARKPSATPASASASSPASVLPPREATDWRTVIGS